MTEQGHQLALGYRELYLDLASDAVEGVEGVACSNLKEIGLVEVLVRRLMAREEQEELRQRQSRRTRQSAGLCWEWTEPCHGDGREVAAWASSTGYLVF